jgi:GNAT superfamily N-acetyltransferase
MTDTPVPVPPVSPDTPVVPVRPLHAGHRRAITRHLLALPAHDRYLRFGYAASDEQVRRYVEQLDFDRDELLGIFNRRLELIALAHLAFAADRALNTCAEFGVSVAASVRGRGYGSLLFERAVIKARNEGVSQLFIHALSENTAMLKIARRAGATLERAGSETEAHLRLPPADFDSRVTELLNEQVAITDYHLKAQAKQFWQALALLQDIRRGVREARQRARG